MLSNLTPDKAESRIAAMRTLGSPDTVDSINVDNRPAARRFLTGLGIPSDKATSMRFETLRKCYTSPRYLRTVLASEHGNADSAETMETVNARLQLVRADAESLGWSEYADQIRANVFVTESGQSATPDPDPAPTPQPATQPATVSQPDGSGQSEVTQLRNALIALIGQTPIDESRVVELINQHAPKSAESIVRHEITITGPDTTRTLPNDEYRHEIFPTLLGHIAAGVHVSLVGPAGCGKSHLVEQAARALEMDYRFNGALSSPHELLGYIHPQTASVIRTPYRESYEHGGVFCFDEMDASDPRAPLKLNAGLANGAQDFPDGIIARHDDFRAVACMNTFGHGSDREYVGRFQQDAAALDRFAVIAMDYDERLERALSGDSEWCDYVQRVRRTVRGFGIRHVVSTRAIINGTKLLAAGLDRATIEESVLFKGMARDDIARVRESV